MARPKSKEPTKNKQVSIRLTEEDYMKIKSVYGSVQKFLDLLVKTLPVLILVSCTPAQVPQEIAKSTAPTEETIAPDPAIAYEIEIGMYSKMTYYTNSPTYFSYGLEVKCTDAKCIVGGYAYEGQSYQRSAYSYRFYPGAELELERSGEFATGEYCNSENNCYNIILKIGVSFSMDNGSKCHKALVNTTQAGLAYALEGSTFFGQRYTMINGIAASSCTPY